MKKILSWVLCAVIVSSLVWAAQVAIVQTDTRQQAWTKETANNTDLQNNINLKQNILSEGAFVDGDKTKLDNQSGVNTGDQAITPEGTAVKSTGETGGIKYLREDGDGTCSWQTPSGSGDVSKVGTPVNQQVGYWAGDGTLAGDTGFVFDPTTNILTVDGGVSVPATADGGQFSLYKEDSDNGTNYVGIGSPVSVTNDLIYLFPATADPTAGQFIKWAVPSSVPFSDGVSRDATQGSWVSFPIEIGVAISDETTDLTTGTAKITFRAPYAFTLTGVRSNVNTAPTGATLTIDINESGTTVLSTKLTIDASEETSTTAATPPVISDSAIADDAEITIDIDQIGSTVAGKGAKVWLLGTRSL